MLQNHINFSVFNGGNFTLYFKLLIEISSNYFLNTFLDFPKRIEIFFENPFYWDKISLVVTMILMY